MNRRGPDNNWFWYSHVWIWFWYVRCEVFSLLGISYVSALPYGRCWAEGINLFVKWRKFGKGSAWKPSFHMTRSNLEQDKAWSPQGWGEEWERNRARWSHWRQWPVTSWWSDKGGMETVSFHISHHVWSEVKCHRSPTPSEGFLFWLWGRRDGYCSREVQEAAVDTEFPLDSWSERQHGEAPADRKETFIRVGPCHLQPTPLPMEPLPLHWLCNSASKWFFFLFWYIGFKPFCHY